MIAKRLLEKYKLLPIQVRASSWFLVCAFFQKAISMITTPIFTRIMSTSDYGKFGVFNSWYGIISIIVALGLHGGVHAQGLVKYDTEKNIFSSSLQGLTVALVLGWLGIYFVFSGFWNSLFSLTTFQMVFMFLIIWSTAVFSFWANEQRLIYAYRILVITTLVSSVIKTVLEVLLVLNFEDKVTARIAGWAIADVIVFGWMFVAQMKKGKVFCKKKYWLYALSFNLPLVPHYLSQSVLNSADRIMIERMVGQSDAGIYNLAYSISLIMLLFNNALGQTLSPWIYQKIKEKRNKDISSIAYITMILIAVVNLLLILLAPEAVAIFAPVEYYDAIYVIPPVAMSVFFMYAYDMFAKFAFYFEKTSFIMIASVLGALMNLILNNIFIKMFGYIAAGYTTLLCFILYAFTHYIFMRKVCREYCDGVYPFNTGKIMVITITFLVFGFLFLASYKLPIFRYGIVVLCILLVFVFKKKITVLIKNLQNVRKH